MIKKYQIFISSTYKDLKNERQAAIKTILKLNHIPIGMEMFSAGDDDQWAVIKRTIDTSDYYVVIIGFRYGSTTDLGISYTEKEYDYAVSKGIPVLAFIKDESVPSTSRQRESDLSKQEKLFSFREKSKNKMAEFWKNKDELATVLATSLHNAFVHNPRSGWIPATQVATDTAGFAVATVVEYKMLHQNKTVPYYAYKIKERSIFGINNENESHWILHQAKSKIHLTASDRFKFKPEEVHEDADGLNGDRVFIASEILAVDLRM